MVDVLNADIFITGPEDANSSALCENVFKGLRVRQALFLDRQPSKEERVAALTLERLRGLDGVRAKVSLREKRGFSYEWFWLQSVSTLIRSFEDIHEFHYDW